MNFHLLQLGDSALPIGGYSHSWGLEAAIGRRTVHDAATLERWARLWLTNAVAPLEGVAVACVCRAVARREWSDVVRANEVLCTSLTPPTLRHASTEMGEQLLALAENWLWAADAARILQSARAPGRMNQWQHAVVFGAFTAVAPCSPADAVALYLHQVCLGIISAGVRGVPIGHTHGQQIVARLHDTLGSLAEQAAHRELVTAGSTCPAYEISCYEQSQLYTRIFRS